MSSKEDFDNITKWQLKRQKEFRSFSTAGTEVEFLEKKFIAHKNVYSPFEDTKLLVENYNINPGETALDACTGSGAIAVFSAYKGAKKVVAFDINHAAVKCAKANAKLHGFADMIDVRLSDMFEAIKGNEKFDVITVNLPFRNKKANDLVQSSQWDTNLAAHQKFFADVRKHLKTDGRVYFLQANYGSIQEMKKLAKNVGLNVKLLAERKSLLAKQAIFYLFEFTARKE